MSEPWFFEVLPYRPSPYPAECLSGYLLRLAEVNGFVSFWDLAIDLFPAFQHTGQARLLRWEYPVADWGRIPLRTQLSVAELRRLTVMPWCEKFRSMPVLTLPSYLSPGHFLRGVVHPGLRVCPLCLQEQGYLRLIWRLAPVHVCTRHKCLLQGQCHRCGTALSVLGPAHRHLRCEACDADLRTLPVEPAADVVETQQRQQADLQFLLDPDVILAHGSSEDLPKALGLKFRYLRLQTGHSVSAMARQMGIRDGQITVLELGQSTSLCFYLTYLEALSYSWPDFAALEVPPEFVQSLEQPYLLHLRLCPQPECPNHRPPPNVGVRLLRDLPDCQRARFRCSACGRRFTCTYEGELVVKPRRPPIAPDRLSRSLKSEAEIDYLVEMGLQGTSNRQIARHLGWGEKTIRLYWEALGIEEQVHQAQAQRRVEKQQERLDALRDQVETTLYALLNQDDEITLCRVSAALGHTPEYLCNYPCLAERIQEVGQLHRIQTRKRQYEMVAAQIHQAIEEAKRENGILTVHEISQRTGMTHQRLSRVFPELHALVQDAVNEHRARMRTERVKAQCAQINAAAMQLVAQGSHLTQAAILRQAGLQTHSTKSNPVVVELLRTWTSDFAPHD